MIVDPSGVNTSSSAVVVGVDEVLNGGAARRRENALQPLLRMVAAQRCRGPVAEAIAGDPPLTVSTSAQRAHQEDLANQGDLLTLPEMHISISSMAFCALPAAAESSSSFLRRGTKRARSNAW